MQTPFRKRYLKYIEIDCYGVELWSEAMEENMFQYF